MNQFATTQWRTREPSPASFLRRFCLLLVLISLLLASAAPSASATAESSASDASYDPLHLLVRFESDASADQRSLLHSALGGVVVNTLDWMQLDVVRLPDGLEPLTAAARYAEDPHVLYAHPNWRVQLLSQPDDLLFQDLWGLHNTGQPVTSSTLVGLVDADIDAPEGWDIAFGADNFPTSGGVRVGVLDTGIDRTHLDLLGKTLSCATAVSGIGVVVEGSCSDDNVHGTHVAGTIAALANNGLGVAGVAPNAELAVFKALNGAGFGFYADVVAGVHWLRTRGDAKIINMSIGGPQDAALDQELSAAYAAGVLLIAAAGNDGNATARYPAYHPDVISVAATNARDERASFSNCNSDVELAAPGVHIWSTTPQNSYLRLSGTSMAAPHAAGVAAMIWDLNRDWSAAQIRDQLSASADDLGTSGRDSCSGFGRVNLAHALAGAAPPPPPPAPGSIVGTVTDGSSSSAISGASIDCDSAGQAVTGSDGRYSLSGVTPGTYTCSASAAGYKARRHSVTVNSGATETVDFRLRPAR